jgi:superfamily I DNA/RNA helicase
VWTPWFAALGSKSGFDAVEDCYADLAEHVFALETGLSSDPEMNWRVSRLDRFRLTSNSDAHSPGMLGRNATALDTELGYAQLRDALRTGAGYVGTVDMFPEEGKYHHDGHRKCGVHLEPEETRALDGKCPECGKPLTVGVLYRVSELADRPAGQPPATAGRSRKIVPLPEIMGEILGVGPKSKAVTQAVTALVEAHGPELPLLLDLPLDQIRDERVAEAIRRLRAGEVRREAGYDGEYGRITLFDPAELATAPALFDLAPAPAAPPRRATAPVPSLPLEAPEPVSVRVPVGGSLLDALDPDQRAAAEVTEGPLLIVAGPGTGKTRTLTHRLAHLVTAHGVDPRACLAITFTRRASEEMRERLDALVPDRAAGITVATFHRLGLDLLREQHHRVGLAADFAVADEPRRLAVLRELLGDVTAREARRALQEVSRAKRTSTTDSTVDDLVTRYDKELRSRGLVDFDDLLVLPVELLTADPELAAHYRDRYRWVCVDEYQDVDEVQYRLLRLLVPADGNLCAIGDPDQAIYSFRGADVAFFLRFRADYPTAREVHLTRNYRSSAVIVAGAVAAVAPTTLVPGRALHAVRALPAADRIAVHAAADEDAEARFVVRAVEDLLGGSTFHSRDSGLVESHGLASGLSFDDIAVLYRTDGQARPIMAALSRSGLPYQKRSHDRLTAHDGVRALLAALPPDQSGDTASLLRRAASHADAAEDVLAEALDLLAPVARRHPADLAGFHAELSLGAEVDTWDPRANRISLLTLHAAKGLEFPVVFLVGCADGLLPLRWPGSTDPEVDAAAEAEERRLFFVGVSRAQTHLYLSHPLRRTRAERVTDLRPSPFLAALGPDLVDRDTSPARPRAPRSQQLRLL